MQILWDESKRRTNLAKHGLDFAELSVDFFADALVTSARAERYKAIGEFNGQAIITVFFFRWARKRLP